MFIKSRPTEILRTSRFQSEDDPNSPQLGLTFNFNSVSGGQERRRAGGRAGGVPLLLAVSEVGCLTVIVGKFTFSLQSEEEAELGCVTLASCCCSGGVHELQS